MTQVTCRCPPLCHQPNEHELVADLAACTFAVALAIVRWQGQQQGPVSDSFLSAWAL
ncbi:hypothetical protein ACQPT2_14440 [Erwinia amylovora]